MLLYWVLQSNYIKCWSHLSIFWEGKEKLSSISTLSNFDVDNVYFFYTTLYKFPLFLHQLFREVAVLHSSSEIQHPTFQNQFQHFTFLFKSQAATESVIGACYKYRFLNNLQRLYITHFCGVGQQNIFFFSFCLTNNRHYQVPFKGTLGKIIRNSETKAVVRVACVIELSFVTWSTYTLTASSYYSSFPVSTRYMSKTPSGCQKPQMVPILCILCFFFFLYIHTFSLKGRSLLLLFGKAELSVSLLLTLGLLLSKILQS